MTEFSAIYVMCTVYVFQFSLTQFVVDFTGSWFHTLNEALSKDVNKQGFPGFNRILAQYVAFRTGHGYFTNQTHDEIVELG